MELQEKNSRVGPKFAVAQQRQCRLELDKIEFFKVKETSERKIWDYFFSVTVPRGDLTPFSSQDDNQSMGQKMAGQPGRAPTPGFQDNNSKPN